MSTELMLIPRSKQSNKTIPIGSNVTITNPFRIIRVGYPISTNDAIEYVKANMSEDIKKLFLSTDSVKPLVLGHELDFVKTALIWPPINRTLSKAYNRIVKELAYVYLSNVGFGGKERTIHTKEYPDYQGKVLVVADRKVVKTGHYYPPSGDSEDWYPGGLSNIKTHVLLKLWDWNIYCRSSSVYDEGFWIESCNVKLG